MNRYESYKDSGLEWIGEIPSHWDLPLGSRIGTYSKGNGIKKDEVVETGLPCIRYGQIYTIYDHSVSEVSSFIDLETSKTSVSVHKGTLLITGSGETKEDIGKCIVYVGESPVWVGGDIIILHPDNSYNPFYLTYLINCESVRIQKEVHSKGEIVVHIYSKNFSQMRFVLPPLPEQEQIVSFLDEKTSKIDDLIKKKEQKIELLKEYRTSLINRVITKGLNPDVPMKDSGVEWIGEIPSHWEVSKMKTGVSLITEKGTPSSDDVKISPENVESNTGRCLSLYSDYEGEGLIFQSGDILLNKLRLYLKKIVLTTSDGFSMGEMIVLRSKRKTDYRYLYYSLFHQGLIDLLDSQSNGVKLPRVSPETIMNTDLMFPPLTEQEQIVSYLDQRTGEIDSTIDSEKKKIDLLKEYRQSLISSVITGKIKVVD